jgi:segregation and condensation protein A
MNLEELVRKPNWREILVGMIISNKIDPWDIDIEKISREFLQKIKEMELKKFDVPANILLACAIILKFKSLTLIPPEEEEPVLEEQDLTDVGKRIVYRMQRKLPVTMQDLIEAVEKEIRKRKKVARRQQTLAAMPVLEIKERDFERELTEFRKKLWERKDEYELIRLSHLPGNIVKNLLMTVFLAHSGDVDFWQERLFDEVFIKILDTQRFQQAQDVLSKAQPG